MPDDVDDPRFAKETGLVQLPLWVEWSGEEPLTYDLDDPVERDRVYEMVLREGTDDDVRRFIDVVVLADRWEALVLPPRVRRAWADWYSRHGIDVSC